MTTHHVTFVDRAQQSVMGPQSMASNWIVNTYDSKALPVRTRRYQGGEF